MADREDTIRTIEKHVFSRLTKCLTDYFEAHDEHVIFDLERDDLGLDSTFFWKYGFQIKEASAYDTYLRLSGLITGELAKPFREHLHSYEVKFEASANWWSGSGSLSQEMRDMDINALEVPVLEQLDEEVLLRITTDIDNIMIEKLTLGESNPLANTFDEMFTKDTE